MIFFSLLENPCPAQENAELTCEGEGLICLSDLDIDMEINLSLEVKEGGITGRITDDWGFLDCDIMDPKFEENILTFKSMAEADRDDHQMEFRMTISGDKMSV